MTLLNPIQHRPLSELSLLCGQREDNTRQITDDSSKQYHLSPCEMYLKRHISITFLRPTIFLCLHLVLLNICLNVEILRVSLLYPRTYSAVLFFLLFIAKRGQAHFVRYSQPKCADKGRFYTSFIAKPIKLSEYKTTGHFLFWCFHFRSLPFHRVFWQRLFS